MKNAIWQNKCIIHARNNISCMNNIFHSNTKMEKKIKIFQRSDVKDEDYPGHDIVH